MFCQPLLHLGVDDGLQSKQFAISLQTNSQNSMNWLGFCTGTTWTVPLPISDTGNIVDRSRLRDESQASTHWDIPAPTVLNRRQPRLITLGNSRHPLLGHVVQWQGTPALTMPPPRILLVSAGVCTTSFLLALIAHRVGIIKLSVKPMMGFLSSTLKNLGGIRDHEHDSQGQVVGISQGDSVSLAVCRRTL